MKTYKQQALKELADQQVRFAPPPRRLEQLRRAEHLLTEIDPKKSYPYQFICYRVNDYRSELHQALLIPGEDAIHDLGLWINDLAVSLPAIPVDDVAEPVMTIEEISKKLNVTTKTIHRWRKRGLIGIPIVCNGHRQLGFLPSLVDPFLAANKDRIAKSGKFTLLTQDEKDEILRRARRFARLGLGSLTEISRRIARRLGRSPETVRYTIKNFDQEHPDQALYPDVTGSLDSTAKQVIYNSYQRGMDVDTLAKNFQRNRSSMYRVLSEIRAQRLLDQPIEYIYHESFDDAAKAEEIMAPMPNATAFEESRRNLRIPKDAPPELISNYQMPLLTKEQEQHLFRKMNFLKYRSFKMLEEMKTPSGLINYARLRVETLDQIEASMKEANQVKELLIRCNMRLVTSIAKRHSGQTENFFELLSDGNISLMRAVEKFDYSRGNKFSTYASWAIMKNFARSIPDEKNRRERFVTGNEEVFDVAEDKRTQEQECVAAAVQASDKVNRLLEHLEPRERDIIRMRAGLDNGDEGMTLEKIGEKLGITKERVRQLNVRAMKKLRTIVETQKEEA
ncbi:MAG: sigma-70 family RNA polymerase sigma factor [Planctomycetes bacterium]|nr:sigma-70 family RNA polymerase sigma factor [Planctomycetota bacterium]